MAEPGKLKKIRCAIYTRKSTAAGLEKDFNSLDAQREACEACITTYAHEGWEMLPEPFDDGGYTGSNVERPGFQKLMTWISRKRVDVVVVYKVDRLSRSLVDFSQVMEHFAKHGVGFVSVTQHFSTTDSVGRLTLNMLMSFAEFEREMITERIRDKVRAARRKGRWTGGVAPLGYRSDKAHLVVHEEEAHWAQAVFRWYLEGLSAMAISEKLNEAGVPLKTIQRLRPNPWGRDLVLRILRNRLYLGELSCQGEFVVGEHPALIDRETFEEVQRRLEPEVRRQNRSSRNPAYLVRGTLICGLCGARMASASTFKKGRIYRYYRCITRDKYGKKRCATVQVPAEAIEDFVVERIQALFGDPAQSLSLRAHIELIGLQAPQEGLTALWETLTPRNRQRLIHLLVEEVELDELQGKVSLRFRDLEEEPAC